MARKRKQAMRGVAQPVYAHEPLVLRLCNAFVDNLAMILRTAFVIGAFFLVQDVRLFTEEVRQPAPGPAPIANVDVVPVTPVEIREPGEAVLTDDVKRALNCTYTEYRNAHYDECVQDDSVIYQRPQAGEDETGYVLYGMQTLYARLDRPDQSD